MSDSELSQLVHTLTFAGLTPSQRSALDALVAALKAQREAAHPFAVLVERYTAYCSQLEGTPRRQWMDFTEWLSSLGEHPAVLLEQFKAVSEGVAHEQA